MFRKHRPDHTDTQSIPGKTLIGHKPGNLLVTTDDDARHIFICGTTGSGKTVALANYIESGFSAAHDYPMLLVDGKGAVGADSMLDIVSKFKGSKKVYVVDMNSPASSAAYNPFKGATSTIAKDMLVNMTTWSEEHYKANAERYLQRLLDIMIKLGMHLSFSSIMANMPEKKLMTLSLQAERQKLISKQEHEETIAIIKASGEITMQASARFSTIAEGEMNPIFRSDDADSGIDIYSALEENAVILFILNPLMYPEISQAMGRLILIDAKQAVSKLFLKTPERVFFLLDEIGSYASPVVTDLLNKSRSANVTCIIATQSLSDLDYAAGEAFKEQIIENTNNYILLRQNSDINAEKWAKIIGTYEALNITYQIGGDDDALIPTGLGSARKERRFHYHPDDIKALKTGEAIFVSKDTAQHCQLKVRKGF